MLYINYGPISFTWYISPFCPDRLLPNTIPLQHFLAMALLEHAVLTTYCTHTHDVMMLKRLLFFS